ncbi:hypothetical protein [Mongoliibacter ruber]|uniref:Uncharacterized protein n=1 Tax=Mongoliibacter ruber TaxID=1750599 RepID=A0A2T0WVA6_9BACT|nr:hypothetical protein [Mongoliibacter ruber]PRY90625.1 hypothetical protein CLW00_101289 [Mongoliibacter ruber]
MIKTNLKKLLLRAGLEEARPTEEALEKMEISRRRFTQLLENTNKTPINVHELESIKKWISGFQMVDTDLLVGEIAEKSCLTEKLGLIK